MDVVVPSTSPGFIFLIYLPICLQTYLQTWLVGVGTQDSASRGVYPSSMSHDSGNIWLPALRDKLLLSYCVFKFIKQESATSLSCRSSGDKGLEPSTTRGIQSHVPYSAARCRWTWWPGQITCPGDFPWYPHSCLVSRIEIRYMHTQQKTLQSCLGEAVQAAGCGYYQGGLLLRPLHTRSGEERLNCL